jgi:hypothetical protein
MHPTHFQFQIGGYCGESHQIEFKRSKLLYRRAPGAYKWKPAVELSPSDDAWAHFWQAVEAAGVWRWNDRYENLDVLDGTQWSLKMRHHGNSLICGGSNAYPGSSAPDYLESCEFGQFIKAARELTGKREIW